MQNRFNQIKTSLSWNYGSTIDASKCQWYDEYFAYSYDYEEYDGISLGLLCDQEQYQDSQKRYDPTV